MPDIHITQKGVEKIFTNLKPNKATGPDGLSPRILKELSSQIAPILAKIFQMSLETGEIPDVWRRPTAEVSPIIEKGEKYNPANYRPVSLRCIYMLQTNGTYTCQQHYDTFGRARYPVSVAAWFPI